MEIKKEAIDIHYHYDVVRMLASQGCKFVTKVRREDFEYYNFTDEEWNREFPMKYSNFKSADILVMVKPSENSPRRGFANPYRKDGLTETDITEDEIDEWEEVSIEEYSGYVYDLNVEFYRNYVANSVLLKNCIYIID